MTKAHKWAGVHSEPTDKKKDKPAPVQGRTEAFVEGHQGGSETKEWVNDG